LVELGGLCTTECSTAAETPEASAKRSWSNMLKEAPLHDPPLR
jgi:hypothetical protein